MTKKCVLFLAVATASLAGSKDPGVLPRLCNGWRLQPGSESISSDPAQDDAANAAVLQEYGFADSTTAAYTRNGHRMQIKATRFNNASGAYGAFTYYVQPQMRV